MSICGGASGRVAGAASHESSGSRRQLWVEIIPPSVIQAPGNGGRPQATRLIAFPTTSIDDAEPAEIAALPVTAVSTRWFPAVSDQLRKQCELLPRASSTGVAGRTSLVLNGLLTAAIGISVAVLSGKHAATDVVAAPRHLELVAHQSEAQADAQPAASRMAVAASDAAGPSFPDAWLMLRRRHFAAHAETPARIDVASIPARTEVASIAETTPPVIEVGVLPKLAAPAPLAWTTTITLAVPVSAPGAAPLLPPTAAADNKAKPVAARSNAQRAPAKAAKAAVSGGATRVIVAPPQALGADWSRNAAAPARSVDAAAQRPSRIWAGRAFDSSR